MVKLEVAEKVKFADTYLKNMKNLRFFFHGVANATLFCYNNCGA